MKKKVTGICIINKNKLINFSVVDIKGNFTTLFDEKRQGCAINYPSFQHLYSSILIMAKNNGFTIPYNKDFGAYWFNISFIDISKPESIDKYAYLNRLFYKVRG